MYLPATSASWYVLEVDLESSQCEHALPQNLKETTARSSHRIVVELRPQPGRVDAADVLLRLLLIYDTAGPLKRVTARPDP